MNKITLVTGLWDIGRDKLSEGWSRSYAHYLDKFKSLLNLDVNLIVYGDTELERFVFEHRSIENTLFIRRTQEWFKSNEYYGLIQKIRINPEWFNQSGWLKDSTQCKLDMYNPLVMSKMFLLHDAKIFDKFDSKYMFWIDAGITNTVHPGYFTHDNVLERISNKIEKFTFVSFPYDGKVEIHGFEYNKMCEYSNDNVDMVCRGGFFGGPKETISQINSLYYSLLIETLSSGFMGTEESLFTILTYKYPEIFDFTEIENNGLLSTFFENAKNDKIILKNKSKIKILTSISQKNVGLYVIGFNSPKQFQTLIDSMIEFDNDFIEKPKKGSPIEFEVISSQPFSRLELSLKSSFTGTYIIKLEKIDSSTTKVTEEYELYTASPVDRLFAELFFDLESFAHKYLEQLETQSKASK